MVSLAKKKRRGPVYAVVDLETTGTSVKTGSRIIQIGCVLVQDGQVINEFETKINPRTVVPLTIEQLTGIKNNDVKDAPLFEDVAPTLKSLLDDTIFVAHNVNFDFPFLNAEFERAGEAPLTIPAIDTVTLSQILMPTAPSFRLRDLTSYLAIDHNQPHSAVSDAVATAHLLIELLKRLADLPTITLQSIVDLQLTLPQKTAWLFERELAKRAVEPQPLKEELYVSNGLVLHKVRPVSVPTAQVAGKYPATKRQKKYLFGDDLAYRPLQSKMMNAIYNQFSQDEPVRQLVLEAGTGTGKTLGYLLPLAYLTYPDHRIVVSTATNLLQQQVAKQTVAILNDHLPFQLTAVVVKGNDHYLSIDRFAHSLAVHEDSQLAQALKARMLVWLLETTTGDLDELNLNAQQAAYFIEVRHRGVRTLNKQSPFYQDDFLVRRARQVATANLIITNHAYLVAHPAELGGDDRGAFLVVDEAQHLSRAVLRQSRQTLTFARVMMILHQLQNLVNQTGEQNLVTLFENLPLGAYNVELLASDLRELEGRLVDFQQALYGLVKGGQDGELVEQAIDNRQLAGMLAPTNPLMVGLEQALSAINLHFTALNHLFSSRSETWLATDRYLMTQFASQLAGLKEATRMIKEAGQLLASQPEACVFWLTIRQGDEQSTLKLSGGLLVANHYLSREVYPHFLNHLFVGATLFTSGRSAYIFNQLDLDRKQVRVKRFASPFDYGQNARLFVAKDAPAPGATAGEDYIDYLAKMIYQLATKTQCQTMVLFNSLLTIEQVYAKLRNTDLFNQRDILAQGISGNREKLLKQFATGTNSLLMGAASFWEGIDLPKEQLELLVVTRLPFDSPNDVINRAQSALLKAAGKNPFYQVELPKATTRLRQGLGRLLRTPQDRGVAVVLDPRLVTKRYGKTIQAALPSDLPVIAESSDLIVVKTKKFLKGPESATNE
ncbi:helicase C-terminal domain-containing protein [Limosilactobacillus fermentum]|uniref:helicase C-terminal domain-containing protein n=1 Tax=Limosilactobacillus fermentum TaxID=1613 RepID=UPI0012478DDA|nr:helicase C-terminal domain-containing protein [Limosilactobacillus fermentum]MBD5808761.1 ATP-dependent DNA helicase [Limosilactobacillus fermentum]MCE0560586.1 3'-5' exoribonuclease [Limosilactobacillus fermentum]MCS8609403.1 ATP-dependent DNA helicase [Limosilactobacillus fermentum]QEY01241.1 ATP-dependent DNA helicase [Limosilactobacillus fermentum]WEB67934.1 helicase C-terminal domain-containing protein [Limosilactobacillus fermentum]